MKEWNVVVSVRKDGFGKAISTLEGYGEVAKTGFYNVLVMRVDEPRLFAEALRERMEREPGIRDCLAHVRPLTKFFTFRSPEDFEARAREAVGEWLPALSGHRFHVRMHRRGFKGRLASNIEERFLDEAILKALARTARSATVDFEEPDVVLDIETVGGQAGMALWTREELERYPFLGLD